MPRKCPWGNDFSDENGHCKFTEGEHMHAAEEEVIPEEVKQEEVIPDDGIRESKEEKKPIIEKHIVNEKKKSFWRRILSS